MARMHPTSTSKHRPIVFMASSSAVLLHAAWITSVVAVCLALCSIHSRKPSSSPSRRHRGSRSASSNHRCGSRESNGTGSVGTAATTPAKVSPTPSDTAKASGAVVDARGDDGGGGPVTVIDVGTHGPIPPAFVPPDPDPAPPRRSLSSGKHTRFAERVGRIRSMRRGGSGEAAAAAAEDDVFVGCHRGGEVGEEGTLWTKTIILGERCRVPSGSDEEDGVDGVTRVRKWKSYRPRQPRSVPVTRSNSFAGVASAGARRPTNPRF